MLLSWSLLFLGGRVGRWGRWEGSEVAKWERWEGSKVARWERCENGESGRWEYLVLFQGWGTQDESKISVFCFLC